MNSPYKDWYEDEDQASAPMMGASLLKSRLPDAFIRYAWWLGAIVFIAVWITESWTSSGMQMNVVGFRQMSRDAFGLITALALCFATLKYWKVRAHNLGPTLCILIATMALVWHGF
jgi:hypothetical protein